MLYLHYGRDLISNVLTEDVQTYPLNNQYVAMFSEKFITQI